MNKRLCHVCWNEPATLTLVDNDDERLDFCEACYQQMADDLKGGILPARSIG